MPVTSATFSVERKNGVLRRCRSRNPGATVARTAVFPIDERAIAPGRSQSG